MRRTTRTTRTPRSKLEIRNPRHVINNKSPFSSSDNEMMSFGLFASSSTHTTSSSSSSSSSNLSPLALPFTVQRSNPNKFNLGTHLDSHFNFNAKSDGLGLWSPTTSQDSVRTAAVSSTYSSFPNPNPNSITITTPSTHNRSAIGPNQHVIDASFNTFPGTFTTSAAHNQSSASAIGPNQRVIDASFSAYSGPFSASSTHNWSSMNSSVKSGLEPVNPPAGNLFGVNPSTKPHKWSLGNGVGDKFNDDDAPVMHLDFSLLSSGSFSQGYGSSQVGYSGQADGSRGKEDSCLFGRPATRENNIVPSIIGKSHGTTSPSATSHGVVSSGFSNANTFTWNDYASHYPFETRSVLYDSSSEHISPSVTTQSLDISSTSLFTKNNLSVVSHNPLKEKESSQAVGFEYKSSLNSQVPDMNSTEEVNSGAHLSENLDHHNPGEDSPCWKGASTHFSSSEQESSQHPMKKLQSNSTSGEDVVLHMDQSLRGMVENAANVVISESVDVNMIVKSLSNLSEFLLHLYSKDECRLKEQDHKALDRVIANLNVCMSSKIQQVDHAQKCSSPQQITSNVLHEVRDNVEYGKDGEELQREEGLPKDYSMVQKIKKVLDDNLEFKEDLPSDPMLYKSLWLEAEAELCVSSYKARLHRAKREMGKAKALDLSEVAPDIKKISISNFSPTAPKLLHEAAGSKTLNTRAPNISLPVFDDNDDVENSVMARFNILKRREESNPVNMAEKEPADVEASGIKIQTSGMTAQKPHLQHLLDTDDVVVMHFHDNQKMQNPVTKEHVDHAVMARLNILKSRGELDSVNAHVSEEGSMMQNEFGPSSGCSASSFGWEYVG